MADGGRSAESRQPFPQLGEVEYEIVFSTNKFDKYFLTGLVFGLLS